VIGGGSLRSGEDSVVGTLIGALIMGLAGKRQRPARHQPLSTAGNHRSGDYSRRVLDELRKRKITWPPSRSEESETPGSAPAIP